MTQEFGKKIFQRILSEQSNRTHIPPEESESGRYSLLLHRTEVSAIEVGEILREKGKKERETRRKEKEQRMRWIEESNTIPFGKPDRLGELHKIMNKRPPIRLGAPHPIDKLVEQENRDYLKANPKNPKPGWGPHGNQTREQIQPSVDRAIENNINRKFETARLQDLIDLANGTYFEGFENEDTQP